MNEFVVTRINSFNAAKALGSRYVYRVCTAAQSGMIVATGELSAADRDANMSVVGHVMNGSRCGSQFISTSKTLMSAYYNYVRYGGCAKDLCIIKINLEEMEDDGLIEGYNVSDERHAIAVFGEKNRRAINRAVKSQEIVLDCSYASISAKAITWISQEEVRSFLDSEEGLRLIRRALGL